MNSKIQWFFKLSGVFLIAAAITPTFNHEFKAYMLEGVVKPAPYSELDLNYYANTMALNIAEAKNNLYGSPDYHKIHKDVLDKTVEIKLTEDVDNLKDQLRTIIRVIMLADQVTLAEEIRAKHLLYLKSEVDKTYTSLMNARNKYLRIVDRDAFNESLSVIKGVSELMEDKETNPDELVIVTSFKAGSVARNFDIMIDYLSGHERVATKFNGNADLVAKANAKIQELLKIKSFVSRFKENISTRMPLSAEENTMAITRQAHDNFRAIHRFHDDITTSVTKAIDRITLYIGLFGVFLGLSGQWLSTRKEKTANTTRPEDKEEPQTSEASKTPV